VKFFYHGTNDIIGDINLIKCRLRTDFGRGFYLSSKLAPAREWAISKSGFSGIPTVMRYEINEDLWSDGLLSILRFDYPSPQWLDFIRDNRQVNLANVNSSEPRHTYDVVSGPIANDKVANVVAVYCLGRISAEDAILKVKAIPSVFQLSMHTALALSYIKSVTYSQRKGGKWSNWTELY
jgi:hypothetical protein